jgi:hypothetical protein
MNVFGKFAYNILRSEMTQWRRKLSCFVQPVWLCTMNVFRQYGYAQWMCSGSMIMHNKCVQAVWLCTINVFRQYGYAQWMCAGKMVIHNKCVQAVWLCTMNVLRQYGYTQYLCTDSKQNKIKRAHNHSFVCDTFLYIILQHVSVFLKSYCQTMQNT